MKKINPLKKETTKAYIVISFLILLLTGVVIGTAKLFVLFGAQY